MCTLDKIIKLLDEQGKTQKDLTDYIGVTKNTFTNWKNGNNSSYKKHISKIAEFLNVSTDYLLTDDEKQDDNIRFALWGGDAEIVDDEMMQDVRDFAKLIAEKKKRKLREQHDKRSE